MLARFDSSVLTLFGIARQAPTTFRAAAEFGLSPTSGEPVVGDPEGAAESDLFLLGSLDGTVSATGDLARKVYGERYIRQIESTGAMFEGHFLQGAGNEGHNMAGYGKFATRRDAMINAYHYAREAATNGVLTASARTMAAKETVAPTEGVEYGRASAQRNYNNATSMLLIQFGFTADAFVKNEDGSTSFAGLEVTHQTYGRMLSVDAKGAVTFYDQAGVAHTGAEYDAARPDGVIPELWNVLNGKSGQIDVRI